MEGSGSGSIPLTGSGTLLATIQELMWTATVLCGIAERGPRPRSQAAVHHPLHQPASAHQYYSNYSTVMIERCRRGE
jgi:hypothetical protein